jgi:hypothetical protein
MIFVAEYDRHPVMNEGYFRGRFPRKDGEYRQFLLLLIPINSRQIYDAG